MEFRCVNAKGDNAGDCEKFAKYYRSLCPGEWVSDFVASCNCNISYCVLVKRMILDFSSLFLSFSLGSANSEVSRILQWVY
jgi:hypothetical protein